MSSGGYILDRKDCEELMVLAWVLSVRLQNFITGVGEI